MLSTTFKMIPRTMRATPAVARAAAAVRMPQAIRAPAALPALTRGYAAGAGLTKDDITKRIMAVLGDFERVDQNKLSPTAAFTSDLGLDSLDAVEVVMAIEEEFNIEIPDADADKITNVQEAINYIEHTPEAN
ncbi:mitochondrial acyl carrier protein [Malassezia sp. CBS 17886]|nr:mitochondrial acyl carrier protein [Malassezia sp. CBS 17886]